MQPTLLLLISTLLSVQIYAQTDTLAYWSFDALTGKQTKEHISNTNFTVRSNWSIAEQAPGPKQNAFRTDGYSTWIEGSLDKTMPTDDIYISVWVALESYPVKTAAVFSHFDIITKRGIHISVDEFGHLIAQVNVNNVLRTLRSPSPISLHKWQQIGFAVHANEGEIRLYNNGESLATSKFQGGPISWQGKRILIGKHPEDEKLDIFPLNALNGLIDELVILQTNPSDEYIRSAFTNALPSGSPDLTIADSRFSTSFHRPKYHGIPKANWTNEPHGLIWHNGKYHLFFQKNGNGPYWSHINWGHMISADLLNWQEEPIILWPEPGFDRVGIWSGHIIKDNADNPVLFYTGVDGAKAGIGMATPLDNNLNTWSKWANNPLIAAAPATIAHKDFRDPYLFRENGSWYMIVGAGLQSPAVGTLFLYKSSNLTQWEYVHSMYSGDPLQYDAGVFWEMPVFWKFGNKYLLLVNKVPNGASPANAFYWTGKFEQEKFVPDNPVATNLELFNHLLSPSVSNDANGYTIGIGIIPDHLPGHRQYQQGWAHLFSIPRMYQLNSQGKLQQSPHPNLKQLRRDSTKHEATAIVPQKTGHMPQVSGFQLEISAAIKQGSAQRAGLVLLRSPNGLEQTKIYYDYIQQELVLDRLTSSRATDVPRDIQRTSLVLPAGEAVNWHVFTDGSVIEVFINNSMAFATRVYPQHPTSNGVDVFAEGGAAQLNNLTVWKLGDDKPFTPVPAEPQEPVPGSGFKIWPNPSSTTQSLQIQVASTTETVADLFICDANGRRVRYLPKAPIENQQFITWDGRSEQGIPVAAGLYYVLIKTRSGKLLSTKAIRY